MNGFRLFQVGDIVTWDEVWGKQKFIVDKMTGNDYCPTLHVYFFGKPQNNKWRCNINAKRAQLVGSIKRPLKNLNQDFLMKLIRKGNKEAKRELIFRTNKIKTKWHI